MSDPVLRVSDLRVRIGTKRGVANIVNGISYEVGAGETLAIVGESGSGKSVSVLALMGLLPQPPATVTGSVVFDGQELMGLSPKEWRSIRGKRMAMIFQDPMTSLNPVRTVGYQLVEPLSLHLGIRGADARKRAVELLDLVGIPSPDSRFDDYPHQLSGGMRQRVMIAMGLACDPDVLIADEATTALDVTIQAQITELVAGLQERLGMAVIWITHDLGVVASIADRVHVMYGGRFMEQALGERSVRSAAPSVHRRAARLHPHAGKRAAGEADDDPRAPAGSGRDAGGLSVRTALPLLRWSDLRGYAAGDAQHGRRHHAAACHYPLEVQR